MARFFAMGGYAAYVWPAFAVTLAAMLGMFFLSWRRARHCEAELKALRREARGVPGRAPRPLVARRETSGASPGSEAR